jgi:S1 RNA binding domain protein
VTDDTQLDQTATDIVEDEFDDADDVVDADAEDDEFEDEPVLEAADLPVPETLEPGLVVRGTVAKLVDFGAFVDIETLTGTLTGLVHVSEVAPGFVDNIYAEIGEGDDVRVKVLSIADDGKIGLSIKQADPSWGDMAELDRPVRSRIDKDFDRRLRKFMHGSQSVQGEVRRQKRNKLGR